MPLILKALTVARPSLTPEQTGWATAKPKPRPIVDIRPEAGDARLTEIPS
jgi:hypothetical protein